MKLLKAIKDSLKEKNPQILRDALSERKDLLVIGFVVVIALFFRLWQIDSTPPGVSAREIIIIKLIDGISWDKLWLGKEFFRGAYLYSAFLWGQIFGLSVLSLRILSAIIGSLTVVFAYLFISKWFSKKVALFTSFLFAVSSFHITISRLIVPEVILPLILLALFTVLTNAYRNKDIWSFGAAGFLVGMGLYTSPAFLFVPFMFLVSGAYFYLKNKKFFTSYKEELLIAALGFFGSVMPFFISFAASPTSYLTHFGFNDSLWQIIMNIGQIPMLLFSGTPRNYFINIGTEPLLDPFIFITAVAGFLLALFGIARRKYFFMVMWLVFFALYAALKRGVQITDLIGILPVLYTFSALILDYILEVWFTTFPYNKSARLFVVTLISILFALTTLYNYERYFVAYQNSKEVRSEFSDKAPIKLK